MLSDEEKKAIEKIRSFNQYNWEMNNLKEKEFAKPYFDTLDTISNLIEKQSKEIEELKEKQKYMHIKLALKGVIKMDLEIEEKLQEKFKNLKIEVDYVKIKMYTIKIGTKTIFYEWKDNLTFSANIENITYYIKIITGGTQ